MDQELCPKCGKPPAVCVCADVQAVKTRTKVLILQHPQEPDKLLGSAGIAHLSLPNSQLKVGLSWRNLSHALGEEADPKDWAVLYLGSARPEADPDGRKLIYVTKDGNALHTDAARPRVKGLLVLDGTWSQAKTLWWRNAWLLKLHRAVVLPEKASLYGNLRKEPRRESVSTIESIAVALADIERDPSLYDRLVAPFALLLKKAKDAGLARPPKKPDYRKRSQQRRFRSRR